MKMYIDKNRYIDKTGKSHRPWLNTSFLELSNYGDRV